MEKNTKFIKIDRLIIGSTLVFLGFSCGSIQAAVDAGALPTNGVVVNGTGTEFTTTGNDMVVDIVGSGNKVIINYDTFDIGKDASVTFNQADANAVVLNRVNGAGPQSEIWGTLNANGNVYIVNPAGVLFGRDAVINVGSLVAAAGNITNEDFNAGSNNFTLSGTLENQASMNSGAVYLLGKIVKNSGNITTNGKTVVMASGDSVKISESGSGISVDVTNATAGTTGIENSGKIEAGAGEVVFGAGDLYSVAILNNGEITGGNVTLKATASGDNGKIQSVAKITASEVVTISGGEVATVALEAKTAEITSTKDISLGATTVDSLNATASRNITQTDKVAVRGTATLKGSGVTLGDEANEFTTVNVTATDAALVDADGMSVTADVANELNVTTKSGDLVLACVKTGTLNAKAENGNIVDSGSVEVYGNADFNAFDSVELDDLEVSGNAKIVATNNVVLDNMQAGVAGDLSITAANVQLLSDIGSDSSSTSSVDIAATGKITVQSVYTENNQSYSISNTSGATVDDVPLTIKGDTLKSANGDIKLGSDMSGAPVTLPTILADNANGVEISANNVEMAHGQKLLAPNGGVSINATNKATLSDIHSAGNLNVQAPSIGFLSRDEMSFTNANGETVTDRGLNFIAKKIDMGNGSTSVDSSIGGTGVVEFSAEEFVSQNISQYILLVADSGSISTSTFVNGLNLIEGVIPAGSPMVDVAQFLAAATPSLMAMEVPEETVSQALRENLVKIGIYARENTETEKRDSFNSEAQFFEMVTSENPQPSDYKVAEGRIESKQAILVYEMSSDIFWDKSKEKPVSKVSEIVNDISAAYMAYKSKLGEANPTPEAFANYLENPPAKKKKTAQGLRPLRWE